MKVDSGGEGSVTLRKATKLVQLTWFLTIEYPLYFSLVQATTTPLPLLHSASLGGTSIGEVTTTRFSTIANPTDQLDLLTL